VVLGIGSRLRRHRVEILWGLFALANLVALVRLPGGETIPFHFVWVSLALVYGFRMWRPRATVITVAAVTLATGAALLMAINEDGGPGLDEMAEVPLMAAMFVAMVTAPRCPARATISASGSSGMIHRDAGHPLHSGSNGSPVIRDEEGDLSRRAIKRRNVAAMSCSKARIEA